MCLNGTDSEVAKSRSSPNVHARQELGRASKPRNANVPLSVPLSVPSIADSKGSFSYKATSKESERVFSIGGDIVTKKRNRLSPSTLRYIFVYEVGLSYRQAMTVMRATMIVLSIQCPDIRIPSGP